MAQKLPAFDPQQREQRQRTYMAVARMRERFPRVEELSIELRFKEPSGKPYQSPHKRIFVPEMQAYFEFQCPMPHCTGGGFDLSADIPKLVTSGKALSRDTRLCQGRRAHTDAPGGRCLVELSYEVAVVSTSD